MGLRAKLRAWLIDLVREAIRSERVQPGNTYSLVVGPTEIPDNPRPRLKPAPDPIEGSSWTIEPSFEQMQSAALKEQAAFYEVAK